MSTKRADNTTTAAASSFDLSSYARALETNRELQESIHKRLTKIAQKKARNRQLAARITNRLLYHAVPQSQSVETKPCCSWQPVFFQGPDGTTPPLNRDAAARRQAEQATFFRSTNPPWSNAELKQLDEAVETVRKQQQRRRKDEEQEVSGLNYELVANALRSKQTKKSKRQTTRTSKECELAHRGLSQSPWEASERENLANLIRRQQQKNQWRKIDWMVVASAISEVCSTRRSAWQCFCEHQKMLAAQRKSKSEPWTLLQDELLFQYIAAMGPQFVVDGEEINFLRANLFREKTKRHLYDRIHTSLLNPLYKNEAWTDVEERRLALCMKVYSSSGSSSSSSKTDKALNLARMHIHGRSGTSVADKWHRSLNPEFSARPFTAQEDEALLTKFHQHPNLGWVELARRFFPDRHAHRLANRFAEIATDQDIWQRHGASLLLHAEAAAGMATGTGASKTATGEQTKLKADELVVRVRKRKR